MRITFHMWLAIAFAIIMLPWGYLKFIRPMLKEIARESVDNRGQM